MSLRIFLIRHGETDWNRQFRIQGGSSDTALNAEGKRQAKKLASRLSRSNIQAVYSSPLERALQTAQAIAKRRGLEVIAEPALREIEVGELEGVTTAELGMPFSSYIVHRGVDKKLPGGESLAELQQRSWGYISRLAEKHKDGDITVITHYFIIMSTICAALNLPLDNITRLRLNTGSISIISFNGTDMRLELYNDSGSLDSL